MKRFLALLFVLVPTLASAAQVDVRPAPAWTDRVAADLGAPIAASDVRSGVYALLTDHQVRVHDGTTVEYNRHVRKVLTAAGVQAASELSIDFDPSFQRLVVHSARIVRDGKSLDALDVPSIRVIEKEPESDDRIYDGQLTAVIFLRDVRAGDVIDYDYSLTGANPLLGNRFADEFAVSGGLATRLVRHRLLVPHGRAIHWRSTAKDVTSSVAAKGESDEYLWSRRNVAAVDAEDETPGWFDPDAFVQVTDFASWNEVARWAVALFHEDAASQRAVHALAESIRANHKTQREQLTAAIRFVQDDIRYLGIELGRNSHEPHAPAETLAQRYGDCKDKSFLLALLLRELGVEAYPALVNTKTRHHLDEYLPAPFLFDHVIVEAIDRGQTYWVDATLADQGGELATLDTPNDERALVIRPESRSLAKIATRDSATTVVEESYTQKEEQSPVALDVRSTYRGGDADAMRAKLADESIAELAKETLNRYAAAHPKIAAKGLPEITDDRERNVVTVVEHYEVRDLWESGSWKYTPAAVLRHLARPETMIRTQPLAFDYPLDVTQRLVFHLPHAIDVEDATDEVSTKAFRVHSRIAQEGATLTIEHHLHALADGVAANDVAEHLQKVNEARDALSYDLPLRAKRSALASALGGNGGAAWAWIVAIACGVALISSRRRAT